MQANPSPIARPVRLLGLLILATLAGCATHRLPTEPGARLSAVEGHLLAARAIDCDFEIESSGAVSSKITGTLKMQRGRGDERDQVQMTAQGTFAGQPIHLSLTTTDGELLGGTDPDHHFGPQPDALIEASVIGWTRMGLLHNIAMLTANRPPDHASGGVMQWVRSTEITREPGSPTLGFGIEVDGQPSGTAELDCTQSGVPIERRQHVEFPNGTMHVIERYTRCSINRS